MDKSETSGKKQPEFIVIQEIEYPELRNKNFIYYPISTMSDILQLQPINVLSEVSCSGPPTFWPQYPHKYVVLGYK